MDETSPKLSSWSQDMDSEQYIHKNDDDPDPRTWTARSRRSWWTAAPTRWSPTSPTRRAHSTIAGRAGTLRWRSCSSFHPFDFQFSIWPAHVAWEVLRQYSFSCRLKCVLIPGGERDHKVPARWSDTIGRQQTVRVSFKRCLFTFSFSTERRCKRNSKYFLDFLSFLGKVDLCFLGLLPWDVRRRGGVTALLNICPSN